MGTRTRRTPSAPAPRAGPIRENRQPTRHISPFGRLAAASVQPAGKSAAYQTGVPYTPRSKPHQTTGDPIPFVLRQRARTVRETQRLEGVRRPTPTIAACD